MTNPKEQAAAAPVPVELSNEDMIRVLSGELDIDAMIGEAMQKRQSPHPTLESIRAEIENWKASWDTNLRNCIENRVKLSGSSAARLVLLTLYKRDFVTARRILTSVQLDDEGRALVAGLSDDEVQTLSIMKGWDAPAVACALGMCAGAMLTETQLDFDEVCELAVDPVLVQYVCMGKLDQSNASYVSLKCLKEIRQLAALD